MFRIFFIFFCSGAEGREEASEGGRGGGPVFAKKKKEGGGRFPTRRGAEGMSVGRGGGGAKYFFRGQNAHQVLKILQIPPASEKTLFVMTLASGPDLMGLFRGAVFHHAGGCPKTNQLTLMGRCPSLMSRFSPLMGRFPRRR